MASTGRGVSALRIHGRRRRGTGCGDPAGRTSGVRQHVVLGASPGGERRRELQAVVAAAVHLKSRPGSLPPQRHGDGGRQAALCHAGRRFRRGRRLVVHRRADAGMVMDVTTGEPLLRGLSMPHSPRLHDGRLWLLNSGAGELGSLDRDAKKFQAVAFCRAMRAGSPSSAPMPSSASRSRAREPHRCRSMRRSPCTRRRAALWWSTPRAATPSSGCASRAWCASCSTSRCCPAYATGRDRLRHR